MVREDIVAGLKGAIERGYPPEKAKESFISAGYNKEEVEESFNSLHSSSVSVPEETQMPKLAAAVQPKKTFWEEQKKEPKKIKSNFKMIILVTILAVLVGVLILTFLFKDKILGLFS